MLVLAQIDRKGRWERIRTAAQAPGSKGALVVWFGQLRAGGRGGEAPSACLKDY